MEFDFSAIESIAARISSQQPTESQESPARHYYQLEREQQELDQAREVYRQHQDAIYKAGQLRTDIIKGVQAAESPYTLLLKAAQCISYMTGDGLFYTQIEADTKAIYGAALLEPVPLGIELDETRQRLVMLQAAEERETETSAKSRIGRAIKAHIAKIEQLERQIAREGG